MSQSFYQLSLQSVPADQEELISELCFSHGAAGISEDLEFEQASATYEPRTLTKSASDLVAYFYQSPGEDLLKALAERFPEVKVRLTEEAQKDWREEWKKGLRAFELTSSWWIVPSWLEDPPEAEKVIRIDPGMAFGTGTHATTRLAADLLRENWNPDWKKVLDVGTGTAVLALLAEGLGAEAIEATEIDTEARRVARENLQHNHSSKVTIHEVQIEKLTAAYDLVIANIIDGVLLELKEELTRKLRRGGHLLLTGILEERAQEFLPHWSSHFQVVETRQRDEWMGYLMVKN